jgi:hypothetical protein
MEMAMPKEFKLKRTQQCAKCPWKVTTNPHDIPRGYDPEKHANLKGTIATAGAIEQVCETLNNSPDRPLRIMACHEEHDAHCIGWLMHQMGPGNNIRLRMTMRHCQNFGDVKLDGEQHERFEDTLPACCSSSHEPRDTACRSFERGENGRCVYCDHEEKCHPGPGATCEIGSGENG